MIDRPVLPAVGILGVQVSTVPLDELAGHIVDWGTGEVPGRVVCATSVHGLIEASRDPGFSGILNSATAIAPDGMPLVWAGRLLGHRHMDRVYGPDLMLRVCQISASCPVRHFFYGGASGVAEELADRLSARFPGLRVAGTHCPPFRVLSPDELAGVARKINDSGADIVWVGLSTPKQERWIASIRHLLQAKVLVSVGAAFDYHTGRLRHAPGWMQRASLEWLYRLRQEPARLWRRYAVNNPVFIGLILLQLSGLRFGGRRGK